MDKNEQGSATENITRFLAFSERTFSFSDNLHTTTARKPHIYFESLCCGVGFLVTVARRIVDEKNKQVHNTTST